MQPGTKECYACRSLVPTLATRCPHCHVELTYGGGNPNWSTGFGESNPGGFRVAIITMIILYCFFKWLGWN